MILNILVGWSTDVLQVIIISQDEYDILAMVKSKMSVNYKDIIRMYQGFNSQKTLPFFCEQQAMDSGYVHISKLPLSSSVP